MSAGVAPRAPLARVLAGISVLLDVTDHYGHRRGLREYARVRRLHGAGGAACACIWLTHLTCAAALACMLAGMRVLLDVAIHYGRRRGLRGHACLRRLHGAGGAARVSITQRGALA